MTKHDIELLAYEAFPNKKMYIKFYKNRNKSTLYFNA